VSQGRALIVGGSLGGLFAAHFLRAAGWQADVFERSGEDLAGRGAGLGTHAALLAMFRRLDIGLDSALGVDTSTYIWLDRDGKVARELVRPRVMTA
jgi:2-polyprenyl-6-methoxyphenol hydroxylase-like FAD-dependent oxidoreductase